MEVPNERGVETGWLWELWREKFRLIGIPNDAKKGVGKRGMIKERYLRDLRLKESDRTLGRQTNGVIKSP